MIKTSPEKPGDNSYKPRITIGTGLESVQENNARRKFPARHKKIVSRHALRRETSNQENQKNIEPNQIDYYLLKNIIRYLLQAPMLQPASNLSNKKNLKNKACSLASTPTAFICPQWRPRAQPKIFLHLSIGNEFY